MKRPVQPWLFQREYLHNSYCLNILHIRLPRPIELVRKTNKGLITTTLPGFSVLFDSVLTNEGRGHELFDSVLTNEGRGHELFDSVLTNERIVTTPSGTSQRTRSVLTNESRNELTSSVLTNEGRGHGLFDSVLTNERIVTTPSACLSARIAKREHSLY
jgi:hypothetical protein